MEEKKRAIIGGDSSMSASAVSEDMLRAIQKRNAEYADIVKDVAEEEGLTDEQIYEAFEQLEELGIQKQKINTATKKKKDKSKTKAKRKQAKKSKQRNR